MFTTAAGIGWVRHSSTITGDILFVLLMLMVICSLQCIRQRSGFYQLFRYTHYLFWPIFILLIIHAQDFWKWSIGPMSLLFFEKLYLLKRHLPKYGRTRLISVRIEDEQVISLMIERPANFHFHTGEYINICLPNISKFLCFISLIIYFVKTLQYAMNGIHLQSQVVPNVKIFFG
jgi:hypothetical protein